jgi:hypothetical protein
VVLFAADDDVPPPLAVQLPWRVVFCYPVGATLKDCPPSLSHPAMVAGSMAASSVALSRSGTRDSISDDDVPPPSAAAPMEGSSSSKGCHAQRLLSLLVPSCHGGRINGGLLCGIV